MKKYFFLILLLLCQVWFTSYAQSLIKPEQIYNLSGSDSVDRIILSESRILDTAIIGTPVWLTDQVATQFDPVFGVVINKADIIRHAAEYNMKDLRSLFRLILAHEKMHALQYARLQMQGKTFGSLVLEEKQLLECQADMSAGYFFLLPDISRYTEILAKSLIYSFHSNPDNGTETHPSVPDFSDADSVLVMNMVAQNKAVISLFFRIGDNEGTFSTHPNSVSRKEAFQNGISAFMFTALSRPFPKELLAEIRPSEWEYLKTHYTFLMTNLAIMPGDFNQYNSFFESWSYRNSFKIIHFSNRACSNVIFRITQNHWDTSVRNPFLYFEMDVTNNNPDSVLADISVPVKLVSRKHPDDPLLSLIGSCWYKMFTLAPGAKIHIRDSVVWIPGSDSMMPRVFYPGEEGSLYSIQPIRPHSMAYYSGAGIVQDKNPNFGEFKDATRFMTVLPSVQREFSNTPVDNFKQGAGIYWFDEPEITYNYYKANYHFLLKVPVTGNSKSYLLSFLSSSLNLKEAQSIYESYKSQLIDAIDNKGYKISDSGLSDGELPFIDIENSHSNIVYNLYMFQDNMKEYRIELKITGAK